jgi:predicted DNA-binding transcriptional regulator YafY
VWLENKDRGWLVNEFGRQPVMVKDVARAVLAATLLAADEDLPAARRLEVDALARRLSEGLGASVNPPAGSAAQDLQEAAKDRRAVRFRYLHPWTGEASTWEVSPYDVRRQRDRLVLDAGRDGVVTAFDVGGISELEITDGAYEPMDLVPPEERTPRVPVVIRVPDGSKADAWLCGAWGGVVRGRAEHGRVDIRVDLDGDVTDEGVVKRLGVLMLQLGAECAVVQPAELRGAAETVGRRLLELHGG